MNILKKKLDDICKEVFQNLSKHNKNSGQATVETALILPFLLILLFACLQVGVIIRDQIAVTHVVREAVRASSVSAFPETVERVAKEATALKSERLQVDILSRGGAGESTTVRVRYEEPIRIPLIAAWFKSFYLQAEATMRVETTT